MHIIWLVEAVKQDFSVTHSLLGNFATRVFSSATTFQKISIFEKNHPPSVLILDLEFADECLIDQIFQFATRHFLKTPILVMNRSPLKITKNMHFLQKPVDIFILVKAIREILKDQILKTDNIIFEDLVFYPSSHEIEFETAAGIERIKLSRQESLILKTLIRNFGKTVSRQAILKEAWDNAKVSDRTMDSHISRLRSALAVSSRIQLLNVYGKGFTLTEDF